MADDAQTEVYRAIVNARDKHTYFLLAAVGAAIAFALNQTQAATLGWSKVPLALAVASWGLSFIFGCRHAVRSEAVLFENFQLLKMQRNELPEFPVHPDFINAIRKDIDERSKLAGRLSILQYKLLIVGAFFYIIWHVLEMYLRAILSHGS